MPLFVQEVAFSRLHIVPMRCNFAQLLVLKKIIKHTPTNAGRTTTTSVFASGANDAVSTHGGGDAPHIGFNVLAASLVHDVLISIRIAVPLGDHRVSFALQFFLLLAGQPLCVALHVLGVQGCLFTSAFLVVFACRGILQLQLESSVQFLFLHCSTLVDSGRQLVQGSLIFFMEFDHSGHHLFLDNVADFLNRVSKRSCTKPAFRKANDQIRNIFLELRCPSTW